MPSSRVQFNFNPSGVVPIGTGVLAGVLDITERAQSQVTIQISGSFTMTVTFEATVDGTNWSVIAATNLNSGASVNTATAGGLYRIASAGLSKIRLNVTAWTSAASFGAIGTEVEG